jgi:hypothetical protein
MVWWLSFSPQRGAAARIHSFGTAMGDVVLRGGDVMLQGEGEEGTVIREGTRCRREVGGRE